MFIDYSVQLAIRLQCAMYNVHCVQYAYLNYQSIRSNMYSTSRNLKKQHANGGKYMKKKTIANMTQCTLWCVLSPKFVMHNEGFRFFLFFTLLRVELSKCYAVNANDENNAVLVVQTIRVIGEYLNASSLRCYHWMRQEIKLLPTTCRH